MREAFLKIFQFENQETYLKNHHLSAYYFDFIYPL